MFYKINIDIFVTHCFIINNNSDSILLPKFKYDIGFPILQGSEVSNNLILAIFLTTQYSTILTYLEYRK